MVSKEWFQTKQKRSKLLQERNKYLGDFVKRTYKKIENNSYLVNIFNKPTKREDSFMVTYELIPLANVRQRTKTEIND